MVNPDDQMAELNLIIEQVSQNYSLIAPVLIRIKSHYNELYRKRDDKNREKKDLEKRCNELGEQVKELCRKVKSLKDKERLMNDKILNLQKELNEKEKAIQDKSSIILDAIQEIPFDESISKRDFIVRWINQKISTGLNCKEELEYINKHPENIVESTNNI
ncbi:hypothetical protein ROZALSC1DRAFT_29482 [Rozella allomycis CSF55]|uniref:Centromere protein H C-terminal domain-containing protein n=1 Tax=Rozella allomycis (strain CSF55) TaxID=988480 RepID=A0A4P9YIH1_ROZAC|nr:hypothetical protein ROZALSC1DRAFT_29482 [Rozella allomycis CSF55]